jgi:hypothetical protein
MAGFSILYRVSKTNSGALPAADKQQGAFPAASR